MAAKRKTKPRKKPKKTKTKIPPIFTLAKATRVAIESGLLTPELRASQAENREVVRAAGKAFAAVKGEQRDHSIVRGVGKALVSQLDREEGRVKPGKKKPKGPTRLQKMRAERDDLKKQLKEAKKAAR